jgi:tetratricopeptide (TPR) repeat protein
MLRGVSPLNDSEEVQDMRIACRGERAEVRPGVRYAAAGICRAIILVLLLHGSAPAQTAKEQVVLHYKQAEAALRAGDSQTAAVEFRKILKLDPGNAEASANLGVIAYRQGDFPQAKQLFSDALKHNAALWDAKAFLGLIDSRTGNPDEGSALLMDAFPHIRNDAVKIDAGVALIHYHQERKTLGQVVSVIRELEDSHPDNPEVLYVAYRAYSDLAAGALEALSKNAPDSGRVQQILGEAAMVQDDFTGAIAHFRRAIEIDPKIPGIRYELGRAILTNSQDAAALQEAQQEFEAELKANPSDVNSEYELGEVFRLSSKLQAAEEHFQRALQLKPEFSNAQFGLGEVLMDESKPAEAISHFTEAIRLDPDNETAHYKLAREYRTVGREQDAAKEMLEVQRLHQLRSKSSQPPS